MLSISHDADTNAMASHDTNANALHDEKVMLNLISISFWSCSGAIDGSYGIMWSWCQCQWHQMTKMSCCMSFNCLDLRNAVKPFFVCNGTTWAKTMLCSYAVIKCSKRKISCWLIFWYISIAKFRLSMKYLYICEYLYIFMFNLFLGFFWNLEFHKIPLCITTVC